MDGFNFHDDIFKRYSERQRLTRSKTREDRRTRSQEWSFPLSDPGEPEKLQQAQRQDESIRSCFNQCTGINPSFFIQNSLLYQIWKPPKREKPLSQLVLPRQYTEQVLRLAHYAPSAGHLGRKKTLSRIQQRFFWPGHLQRCRRPLQQVPDVSVDCLEKATSGPPHSFTRDGRTYGENSHGHGWAPSKD